VRHDHNVLKVELVDQRERVVDVSPERVAREQRRLVRAPEAHVVERHTALASGGQLGDRMAPKVAPGRVAVHEQQRGRVARPLVDVVKSHVAGVDETRLERKRSLKVPIQWRSHHSGAYS
jgi:hypothetical protein